MRPQRLLMMLREHADGALPEEEVTEMLSLYVK